MEPLIQAQIMITLTHIPHQWPYPHPFVSVAQSQVDFGDASPVSQWAPFVMGDVLALASPRREMWDLCPVMCEGEGMGRSLWRGQRGTWRPTRSQPVTGHHIRLRAGMRTFRTPRPARERDVQKSKLPQTSPCDRRKWDSSAETLKKKKKSVLSGQHVKFSRTYWCSQCYWENIRKSIKNKKNSPWTFCEMTEMAAT